ncbi:MAG: hypothetical protein KA146_07900 [Leptospiraceae bacterium]|nr:hypothetical protein [Leptospiraceae bacterium]
MSDSLSSLRGSKFTVILKTPKSDIPISITKNTLFRTEANADFPTKDLEDIYGNAIAARTESEYISASKIGLMSEDIPNHEQLNSNWLKKIGIKNIVFIEEPNFKFDYPSRLKDLSFGNFLYNFIILDIWWIDLTGNWSVEHAFKLSVREVNTRVTKTPIPVNSTSNLDSYVLRSIPSKQLHSQITDNVSQSLR